MGRFLDALKDQKARNKIKVFGNRKILLHNFLLTKKRKKRFLKGEKVITKQRCFLSGSTHSVTCLFRLNRNFIRQRLGYIPMLTISSW